MQDRVRPVLVLGVGDPGPEDVVLQERHAARVLHRAGVVLGREELVVLAERIPDAEGPMVEVEALPGDLQDLVRVEVRGQGLAAVEAERNAVVLAGYLVIRTCRDRGYVGRHDRRRREVPADGAPFGW